MVEVEGRCAKVGSQEGRPLRRLAYCQPYPCEVHGRPVRPALWAAHASHPCGRFRNDSPHTEHSEEAVRDLVIGPLPLRASILAKRWCNRLADEPKNQVLESVDAGRGPCGEMLGFAREWNAR